MRDVLLRGGEGGLRDLLEEARGIQSHVHEEELDLGPSSRTVGEGSCHGGAYRTYGPLFTGWFPLGSFVDEVAGSRADEADRGSHRCVLDHSGGTSASSSSIIATRPRLVVTTTCRHQSASSSPVPTTLETNSKRTPPPRSAPLIERQNECRLLI